MLYARNTPPFPADPPADAPAREEEMVWDKRKIAAGVLVVLLLLGWIGSCDDSPSVSEDERGRDTSSSVEAAPRESAAERRREARQERQQAARLEAAMLAEAQQACRREDGEPTPVTNQSQAAAVRCDVENYVALIGWDGDDNDVYWTRWWRIGTKPLRVLGRAFSSRTPARVPTPPPPPKPVYVAPPAPQAPSAPSGPPSGYFQGNTGYTGPRCYAPGGVYWKPC